ncbi:uncharacterized protein [Amphiura filiformis]|uniref:uncharacterized protein n=1 Tax=Amphiura filiformis TaxID=82378 RepID=UPI003B217772
MTTNTKYVPTDYYRLFTNTLAYPPAPSSPPQNQSAPGDPYPPQAPPSNTYPPQNTAPPTAPYPLQGTPPNTTPYPPQNQTPYPSQNTTPYPAQGTPPNTAPYPPQGSACPPQENDTADPPPRYSAVMAATSNTNYGYQHDQQTPTNYPPAQPYAYPQQPAPQVIVQNNQVQQQPTAPANITIVRSVQVDAGSPPNNYLCLSIVSFFFCPILGIVSIVYSAQVNTIWKHGRHNEARQAADKARGFAIAAVVFGIGIIVLNVLLNQRF